MNAFTQILTEDRQYDSHMAALACETPGGFTRPFLAALQDVARNRLEWFTAHPVSTEGHAYLVEHRIRQRISKTSALKSIVSQTGILLEGAPYEYEDAAADLDYHLEFYDELERAALERVRMGGSHVPMVSL